MLYLLRLNSLSVLYGEQPCLGRHYASTAVTFMPQLNLAWTDKDPSDKMSA